MFVVTFLNEIGLNMVGKSAKCDHSEYSNHILSAYDMKNIFCLFERPFKIQKNGVFLFEISIFVLEILTFFYYAN